jgi:hypothetical protein
MRLKFEIKKFKDMTKEELEKEKKQGWFLAVLGIIGVIAFLFLFVLKSYMTTTLAQFELDAIFMMFIVSLIGIIQIVTVNFELRIKEIERK